MNPVFLWFLPFRVSLPKTGLSGYAPLSLESDLPSLIGPTTGTTLAKRRPNKPSKSNRGRRPGGKGGQRTPSALKLRALPGGAGWALVSPPSAVEREDDLDEVRQMIEAGETEIATDELRYLLSGCPELLAAHVLLGQLAVDSDESKPGDIELARGHFGYAFQLGEKALQGQSGKLPGSDPANAPWHESARGLAWCFEKQGNRPMADQIAATARRWDPTDPAEVAAMLDDLRAGGLPIVELG